MGYAPSATGDRKERSGHKLGLDGASVLEYTDRVLGETPRSTSVRENPGRRVFLWEELL